MGCRSSCVYGDAAPPLLPPRPPPGVRGAEIKSPCRRFRSCASPVDNVVYLEYADVGLLLLPYMHNTTFCSSSGRLIRVVFATGLYFTCLKKQFTYVNALFIHLLGYGRSLEAFVFCSARWYCSPRGVGTHVMGLQHFSIGSA